MVFEQNRLSQAIKETSVLDKTLTNDDREKRKIRATWTGLKCAFRWAT